MQVQPASEKARKISRGRIHLITSCTECHKRKQKCDQEQPCRHCARRFPQPDCIYPVKQLAASKGRQNTSSCQPGQRQVVVWQLLDKKAERSAEIHQCEVTEDSAQQTDASEPTDVEDVGSSYQKSLDLMLLPLFRAVETESILTRDDSKVKTPTSYEILGNGTDTMKLEEMHSRSVIPKSLFGVSSVEPLHYLPIRPTVMNGELLQIYMRILTKFVVSIDGNPSPNYYNDDWVPWSIKTPLLAQIAIYTAACYQSEARRAPADKSQLALRHKLRCISLLNEALRTPGRSTSDEAIATVVYLTTNEWYWGARQNILAHKTGLREMVRLRGGIGALENEFLRKTILLCDYHIACSFDVEPSFNYHPSPQKSRFTSQLCPLSFESPLLPSSRDFADHYQSIGIAKETAIILDDVRFLFQAVINDTDPTKPLDLADGIKLATTSTWVHDRIISLSPGTSLRTDFMHLSCRQAVLIYCRAISSRTPLSRSCTMQDLTQLWTSVWRIKLSQWKKVPGIFIWILLAVNQTAQDAPHGRLIKSLLKSASFYIALESWEAVGSCLEAFVRLQRWLRGEGRGEQMA